MLSTLHRLGVDAFLTLGNKKGVDIAIAKPSELTASVEVKGVAGKDDWPADNIKLLNELRHFYALVSYEGRVADPTTMPNIWVVPSVRLKPFLRTYKTRTVVSRAALRNEGKVFHTAWHFLASKPPPDIPIDPPPAGPPMQVQSAWLNGHGASLVIDGHHVETGEKYTIIELGFSVLLAVNEASHD